MVGTTATSVSVPGYIHPFKTEDFLAKCLIHLLLGRPSKTWFLGLKMGVNDSKLCGEIPVKYHFNFCRWVCHLKFCSKNNVFGRPFFCKCQNPTESIILFVMRRGWSPWWCTTALAPTPAVDRGDTLIDLVVTEWRLWWSSKTWRCSISVIICLRVNHQAKSVTVPTGSFFSPNDFCVWPSKRVKVKL